MRFTVNLHCVQDDRDTINHRFPVNTFVTDDINKLLRELKDLFNNSLSGINKIVILDSDHGQLSESRVGQSPRELN